MSSADENSLLVRPGLGERIFLGGAVAWVAAVVGMLSGPLVYTVFGGYWGVVVPVGVLVVGWVRVALVRVRFSRDGFVAVNTWRTFRATWREVDRLHDGRCYLGSGPSVVRVWFRDASGISRFVPPEGPTLEGTVRFRDERFAEIEQEIGRRYRPRFNYPRSTS